MTSTIPFSQRIEQLRTLLAESDAILIGAGSGLSTAAGLNYAGDDFRREFAPWIDRYAITDLYTSSFYPYPTKEEFWAYWAMHIWFARYRTGALPLYKKLRYLLQGRDFFVITTNADGQFLQADFPADRLFYTQGDYRFFQPASGSPKLLVDNRPWVEEALPLIDHCRIPSSLIPRMPDGQEATLNLRVDGTFVEDEQWHAMAERYTTFVRQSEQKRLLLLEFGIGFNTPGIIRLPFEQMASRFPNATLVRFNAHHPEPYTEGLSRFLAFTEPIADLFAAL